MIDPRQSALVAALALPADALVNQRVPKKLLIENDAPTSADKRMINDGIEEIYWLAALKPTIIGVPEYRSEEREYLEIAVLTAIFRPQAKASRLIELIHRSIPYPVVLVAVQDGKFSLSLAHKRFSQAEEEKTITEGVMLTPNLVLDDSTPQEVTDFLATLSLSIQPSATLYSLYQGWIEKVESLAAARITGQYVPADTQATATARHIALDEYGLLQREIAGLRSVAAKERQFNRRVELNMKISALETRLQDIKKNL